ncbi:MAG: zf-HC2 domain-containing protein [Peptococcaceae bacterium]|nr:zf-HC2 domain-containing protein [Peptococcaceae bacterium]
MRCEIVRPMLHDLLDKTLSPEEAREVGDHLAACESCRSEFQELKRVDDLLREAVCEMINAIEVPPDLGGRIEKILAERKNKTLVGWLAAFLKPPAVAALLLTVVAAAGIFSFHNYFRPAANQSKVVLEDPQTSSKQLQNENAPGGLSLLTLDGELHDELSAPAEPEQLEQSGERDEVRAVQDRVSAGGGSGAAADLKERQASSVKLQVPPAAPQPTQEKSFPAPAAGGFFAAAAPSLKKGTIEEAAGEVGFVPARPAYLPRGAELQEVTWLSGTICQSYRAGQFSFTISQSRRDVAVPFYDEAARQGTPVQINGLRAILQETRPETVGGTPRVFTTVRWQRGEWIFSVCGDLPGEEIIKIASSL